MQYLKYFIIFLCVSQTYAATVNKDPNEILTKMVNEIALVNNNYLENCNVLKNRISVINASLILEKNIETKVNLLIEKDQIKTEI